MVTKIQIHTLTPRNTDLTSLLTHALSSLYIYLCFDKFFENSNNRVLEVQRKELSWLKVSRKLRVLKPCPVPIHDNKFDKPFLEVSSSPGGWACNKDAASRFCQIGLV